MVHLPTALRSQNFLILYLLLCKTPTTCKTWINTHVFAVHRFLIHSAQKVVQAHQKPVLLSLLVKTGVTSGSEQAGSQEAISASQCTATIHCNCNPRKDARRVSGALILPCWVSFGPATCAGSPGSAGVQITHCPLELKHIAVLRLSSSGRQFE